MIIQLNEVRRVFGEVLDGRMTREEADRWAYSIIQRSDTEKTTFEPKAEKEKIWAGVMFLYGIDMQEAPGTYLHRIEDVREAMEKL